ncbi:hypothetical protein ACYOEI_12485, partial [Singulisphaera rosea]
PALSLAASELSSRAHATFIHPQLLETTVRAATAFAARTDLTTGALSAAAVTLTEGVLRTMLLAKWKSVAVVSIATIGIGSAVHAQFGGDALPSKEVGESSKPARLATAGESSPQEADRLKGLESKLDRILRALEGTTKATDVRAASREAKRNQERSSSAALPATAAVGRSHPDPATAAPALGSDRLSLIEGRLARVEQRLDALEKGLSRASSDPFKVQDATSARAQALYDHVLNGSVAPSADPDNASEDGFKSGETVVPEGDRLGPDPRTRQDTLPARGGPNSLADPQVARPLGEVEPPSNDVRPPR